MSVQKNAGLIIIKIGKNANFKLDLKIKSCKNKIFKLNLINKLVKKIVRQIQ